MTKKPITGTTVWPTIGRKPRAKSSTPHTAARTSTRRLSRAEIHSSRQSGSADSGAVPSGDTSRSTCSDRIS
ncbi:hypothetical protein GCM10014715_35430 [Streptomyces spiralis]|uniref:Uncharacterized protein n=1 Tax=Streptomyces spiralis TaxID=66376 RepID=A0A919DS06_9ACTN|nr:hypothetical protein GCM10014715_35430 [Streptomyces spiralis]